jgi:hypothetical protein
LPIESSALKVWNSIRNEPTTVQYKNGSTKQKSLYQAFQDILDKTVKSINLDSVNSSKDINGRNRGSGFARSFQPVQGAIDRSTVSGNPRDPDGVWGRSTLDEGDAYSGNKSWGWADGR